MMDDDDDEVASDVGSTTGEISVDLSDVVEDEAPVRRPPPPPRAVPALPPPPPPNRSIVAIPPRPPGAAMRVPPLGAKPPMIPRATGPIPTVAIPPPAVAVLARDAATDDDSPVAEPRTRPPSVPPPRPSEPIEKAEDYTTAGADLASMADGAGVEVSTATPNIVIDQSLEASLESPTVIDRALEEIGDAGSEKRAETVARDLEQTSDPNAAAYLAYELGELYERRLADEARAVKAYGRSLTLDPSLRPNLWAIRRVFYRRGLWPNLAKLIGAEVEYARDDLERADLLLEKSRVLGTQMNSPTDARAALEEAVRIAPAHQGALLELERLLARAGDTAALLDVW
ncbi:MAG: hypothetical protein ABI175_28085, partial [Polyangiales bacterium]